MPFAMLKTASCSVGPAGFHSSTSAACNFANSCRSSQGRINISANTPCFRLRTRLCITQASHSSWRPAPCAEAAAAPRLAASSRIRRERDCHRGSRFLDIRLHPSGRIRDRGDGDSLRGCRRSRSGFGAPSTDRHGSGTRCLPGSTFTLHGCPCRFCAPHTVALEPPGEACNGSPDY
jgi:hypothetical protein